MFSFLRKTWKPVVFLLAGSIFCSMEKKYILFLGDSLTYGYMVPSDRSYPSLLEKRLRKEKKIDSSFVFVNAGVPGDTAYMALLRLESLLQRYEPVFMAVVFLGANDYFQGIDVALTGKNLKEIINLFYKKNKQTKILLIPFYPEEESARERYRDMYGEIKETYPDVVITGDIFGRVLKNPGWLLKDGIHPDEEGYEFFAGEVYPYMIEHLP